MRARLIEVQSFERGLEPKESMGIGNKYAQKAKIEKISKIIEKEKPGLFAIYLWESDNTSTYYYGLPKRALEKYIDLVFYALQELEEDNYEVRKNIYAYKIDPLKEGTFIEEKEPLGFDGVKILFGISFQNGKIYYY
jgi:hypothetical protein